MEKLRVYQVFGEDCRVHYSTIVEAHNEEEAFLIWFNRNGDYSENNYDRQWELYKKTTYVIEGDMVKYKEGKEYLIPMKDE